MNKTPEQSFIDWESYVFGFGYGSGEPHIIPALKVFFSLCPADTHYWSEDLEKKMNPTILWLFINALCRCDILEYGTSPRGAWLTPSGQALKKFIDGKTADELVDLVTNHDDDYIHCYPDACNCGPHGYEKGRVCRNPFWGKP